MKKRALAFTLALAVCLALLAGCNKKSDFKAGVVSDAGNLEDRSFNRGVWNGVKQASEEHQVEIKFVQPDPATQDQYLTEIGTLYHDGYRVVFAPGVLFADSIAQAQAQYPDCYFIGVDYTLEQIGEKTLCMTFAEHQAGFLAGFATALELKEGAFGAVLGMEVPSVQRYNWGFQQGVAYANDHYGTRITMSPENFVYATAFDDSDQGARLAAELFDRDVRCVFIAAGQTGIGALAEAKGRRAAGEDVWAVGSDIDQFETGIYQGEDSVIVTTALKRIDQASHDALAAIVKGEFQGGSVLHYDITNDGVGLPEENPNLSEGTLTVVADMHEQMKSGQLKASDQGDGLIP